MEALSLLSTWLGAVGTFLSAVVALVQLFVQMRKGHTSRIGFWFVTVVFLISAPLTAYGGYSLYNQYKTAYDYALRLSMIARFGPDFAPAQLNELGENSSRSISIYKEHIALPERLSWYAVTSPPESTPDTLQELHTTSALQLNFPQEIAYLYYQSTINKNRWGWSAVALSLITPINITSKSKLIILLDSSADDVIELKLRDFHGSVSKLYVPIKKG